MDQSPEAIKAAIDKRHKHHGKVPRTLSTLYSIVFGSRDIKVRAHLGKDGLGASAWVEIPARKFYISYDHVEHQVIVRRENMQGEEIARLDDSVPADEIRRILTA